MGIFKWLKKATKVIGKMAVEAAEEDERSKYSPNPEWMGQMDLVNSRANARILAPQLLKQAQDCARILSSTTEPSTFFMRYDFCVGRLMMLEDCKKYGVNAATTDSLNKYTDLDFRDGAIEELIHRTQIKYSNKILTLKTSKAKENWAAKYHQAFEPYLSYMSDRQKTALGEASAENKRPLGKAEGPMYKGTVSISPFMCELGSSQRGSVYFQLFAVIL